MREALKFCLLAMKSVCLACHSLVIITSFTQRIKVNSTSHAHINRNYIKSFFKFAWLALDFVSELLGLFFD